MKQSQSTGMFARLLFLTTLLGILPVFIIAIPLILPIHDSMDDLRLVLGVLLMAMPVATLCLTSIAFRDIRKMMQRMALAQRQLRQGNIHYRLPLDGDPDTNNLFRGFNTMAELTHASFEALAVREQERLLANLAMQVAHDIRSPLTALQGIVERIEAGDIDPTALKGPIGRIQAIAQDLIARHRIQGCTEEVKSPQPEPLRSSEWIRETILEKNLEYANDNMEILLHVERDSWSNALGEHQVKRILSNVLNNSVEARTDGRVRIDVHLTWMNGCAVIRIKDNGSGIPASVLPLLFKRGVSAGKKSGSGLGLWHAAENLKSCSGTIDVSSELGVGTEVVLRIPAALALDQSSVEQSEGIDALLLDNDVWVREDWQSAAEKAGIKLAAFSDPVTFLAAAASSPLSTEIFIDQDLGTGLAGLDVAAMLFAAGFRNLHMATGHDLDDMRSTRVVASIRGKNPPWRA